jgi:putative addiction module component (TIGR02574 family)
MSMALEDLVKVALELPEDDRIKLAGVLLDSTDAEPEDEVSAAWEEEIQARIRAIDEGREEGIPHEEVMRELRARLKS